MNPQELIQEEMAQEVIKIFGIGDAAPEKQATLIAQLGENIYARLVVSVAQIVPPERHTELEQLLGEGDLEKLNNFLKPYIPNFAEFIESEVKKEITETKALMTQGA